MTSLTINGSAAAATTLATAGKLFNTTGGTSGNTSTKVGTGTQFKQIFAKGTTTNQTGVASIPAPTDSNFNGWMWDVTTLEGQEIAAGTWTPTFHLLASTGTTITPTVAWFKRSSAGAYTSIGSVAGSSIALTTSSQALTFTPPSLALMDFATGDKLVMWLWVNQTAGGATNSTISVVEATSASSAGVASQVQAATPGYAPTPGVLIVTMAGVGTMTATLSIPVLVVYGSSVADTTLTTACLMASASGGVETSKQTSYSGGSGNFGEVWSKGNASTPAVASIPTPTGNGWIYYPGAGTFMAGNWALVITYAVFANNGNAQTFRIYQLSGGVYTAIGTITFADTTAAKTTYSPAAVSMPAATFASGDGLYFDLWYQSSFGAVGDNATVYESTSATAGVTSDMQVTTAVFTPAGSGVALSVTCAGTGTLTMSAPSLSTALTAECDGVGVLTPTLSANLALPSVTLSGVGTLSATPAPLTTVLSTTLVGVGTLSGTLSTSGGSVVLTGECDGVGTFTGGTIALSTAVAAECDGIGVLTGTLAAITPLTVYTLNTQDTTITTANILATALGGTQGGTATTAIGTSTGYGEIYARGHAVAWPAFASVQSPNGSGYLLDSTVLEGQTIPAGNWTPAFRILLGGSATTATADLIVAAYKYNITSLAYTPIGTCTLLGQSLTVGSNFTWAATSLGAMSFGIGDRLYFETWQNITVGSNSGTGTVRWAQSTNATLGVATDEVITPGYSQTPGFLAVTMAGVGQLAGTLSTSGNVALAVTMAGAGTLTSTTSLATAFTITLPSIGLLSGPLSASLTMPGVSLVGVGTFSGTVTETTTLATTLVGVGILSGTLSAALTLPTISMDGVGTLTGTIIEQTALATTMAGVGQLAGTLSTSGNVALAVTMAGAGTLTGTSQLTTALLTTLAGVGTLTGVSQLTTVLLTTCVGVGTLTGTGSFASAFSTTLSGTGALTGLMVLTTALAVQLPAVGILSGTGSFALSLPGVSLVGSGTLTGTLDTSTHVALAVTFAGSCILVGTPALTTSLPTSILAGSGTLTGTLALTTSFLGTLGGESTLAGTLGLQTVLTANMVGTGILASTLFLSTALTASLLGIGTATALFSMQVALSLLVVGKGTSSAVINALGEVVLSLRPIGSLPPSSYGGKTVVPARPAGVYMVNGIPLDSQPIVCTAPLESGGGLRFLVGSTFFLLFDRPSLLTQSLLPDGSVVSMTFALASGNMVTVPQVQVASTLVMGVSISTFAVTCTLLSSLATPTLSLASSS